MLSLFGLRVRVRQRIGIMDGKTVGISWFHGGRLKLKKQVLRICIGTGIFCMILVTVEKNPRYFGKRLVHLPSMLRIEMLDQTIENVWCQDERTTHIQSLQMFVLYMRRKWYSNMNQRFIQFSPHRLPHVRRWSHQSDNYWILVRYIHRCRQN